MANASVAENQVVLPLGTQVNEGGLVQSFMGTHQYEIFRKGAEHIQYGRLRESADKTYFVCDLIIVSHVNSSKMEDAVPKMDAIAEQIRRDLLRGKFTYKDLVLQTHPFMRLHRPLIQHSYLHHEKAVGFSIRPLLIVRDKENLWDYYMGATTRVDAVSLQGGALDYYLKEHVDTLKNIHFLDFKKFHYAKIAPKLIKYGHYPIILLWVALLASTIFQIPFPLDLTGMILLTILPYIGLIGAVYGLHQLFAYTCKTELQEPAPFQSPRLMGSTSPQGRMDNEITLAVEPEGSQIATEDQGVAIAPNLKELPRKDQENPTFKVHKLVQGFIITQGSEEFNAISNHLLFAVFYLFLEKNKQELPKNRPSLIELLKLVRTDSAFNNYYRKLAQWVKKLETQTPFEKLEMANFKKFILQMLYGLHLLPDYILEGMTQNGLVPDEQASMPSPPIDLPVPKRNDTPPPQRREASTQLANGNQAQRGNSPPIQKGLEPASKSPPELPAMRMNPFQESPDIEVDSQPSVPLPEINRVQYQQICARDSNGIFCTLIIDKKTPEFPEIVQQFTASTDNYDIYTCFTDATQFDDPLVQRELAVTSLPAIAIGYGTNRQVVPYKGSQEDDKRLNSLITSYLQRQTDINEQGGRQTRTPEIEESEPSNTNLISLKSRQEVPKEGITDHPKESLTIPPVETEKPNPIAIPQQPISQETLSKDDLEQEGQSVQEISEKELAQIVQEEKLTSTSAIPIRQPNTIGEADLITKEGMRAHEDRVVEEESSGDINSDLSQDFKTLGRKLALFLNMKETLVLIDGTNLLYLFKDNHEAGDEPRAECVFLVVKALLSWGVPEKNITVFFDANIDERFKKFKREDDSKQLNAYMAQGKVLKFRKITGGIKADTALAALGNNSFNYIVLTNDGLKEYPNARRHRVGVSLDNDNNPIFLVDSMTDLAKICYGISESHKHNSRRDDSC